MLLIMALREYISGSVVNKRWVWMCSSNGAVDAADNGLTRGHIWKCSE